MKINDICSYAPKSQIKAGDACADGVYVFFTSSADENKRYSDYQLDGEGIVMGTGGNATLHYYNGKFAVSTDCIVLLPDNRVKCKYLYFKKNIHILEAGFKGAGLRHTNKGYIGNINFGDIPSHEKQKRVILALDSVQQIIDARQQQLAKLDDLIKARFVEMFGDSENNNKAWPVKSLDKLCTVGSSKRVYQSEQSSTGVPFWRISDLVSKMDTGIVDSTLFISKKKYIELKQDGLVPVPGDILVTSRGTLGRCYIIKEEDCFYFQDGMISWLSNYSKEIAPLYLQYLFTMSGFRKQIDKMQAGSTVAYLSITMLKRLQVMVPDKELQEQFATFIAQVDKSKVAVQKVLDEAQLLFDSLMQQYFG